MNIIQLAAVATMMIAAPSSAHPAKPVTAGPAAHLAAAATPAARVVDAFHAALRRGDTAAAKAMLLPEALIFEEGGAERSRDEYASEHLGADAAFTQAVPSTVTRRSGDAAGAMAWVATEGRTTGAFKATAIDRVTTETIVLRRVGRAWKIAHIHWSSAAKK